MREKLERAGLLDDYLTPQATAAADEDKVSFSKTFTYINTFLQSYIAYGWLTIVGLHFAAALIELLINPVCD